MIDCLLEDYNHHPQVKSITKHLKMGQNFKNSDILHIAFSNSEMLDFILKAKLEFQKT